MLHNEARKLLIQALEKTHNAREVAENFSVNRGTVYHMRSHHTQAVKDLLEQAGVQYLYLPPYSPDLNPIEKMWSNLKAFLRKAKVRLLEKLPDAVRAAFKTISSHDCSGWFRVCGYSR